MRIAQELAGGGKGPDFSAHDIAIFALLAGLACFLWYSVLTPCVPWGDDWAAYVLQGKALAAGDALAELQRNAEIIRGGDVQLGPDAYPWGYPALLAAIGLLLGWEITTLKALGIGAAVIVGCAGYACARHFLNRPAAYICALLATLQGTVLVNASMIASDAVFLALTCVSLWVTTSAYQPWRVGNRAGWPKLLLLAALSAVGFSVRSNGVVTVCTVAGCIAIAVALLPNSRKVLLTDGAIYLGLTGLLIVLYFLAFPDGSLSHVSYFSADPRVWVGEGLTHVRELSRFFPFSLLPGVAKIFLVLPFVALAIAGAVARPLTSLPLTLCVAGHIALITVFPLSGGPRYYFPVLLPALILAALGVSALLPQFAKSVGWKRAATVRVAVVCGAVTLLTASNASSELVQYELDCKRATGPFSDGTAQLVSFVQTEISPSARVAFRKPRALRFLSGRSAFAISDPSNLERIDVYIFDSNGSDNQVPLASIESSKSFRAVSDVGPYRIFHRIN